MKLDDPSPEPGSGDLMMSKGGRVQSRLDQVRSCKKFSFCPKSSGEPLKGVRHITFVFLKDESVK